MGRRGRLAAPRRRRDHVRDVARPRAPAAGLRLLPLADGRSRGLRPLRRAAPGLALPRPPWPRAARRGQLRIEGKEAAARPPFRSRRLCPARSSCALRAPSATPRAGPGHRTSVLPRLEGVRPTLDAASPKTVAPRERPAASLLDAAASA